MELKTVKVTAVLEWQLELPENELCVAKIAKSTLESILPKNFNIQVLKTSHKVKSKLQRLGEFTLEEIFSKLTKTCDKVEFKVDDKIYHVRMNSSRYFLFQDNYTCVSCGLVGSKFILEKHPNDSVPHFNLYAVENNELVLMTKDHTFPKSKGGLDKNENFQPCCSICNNLKADSHLTYDQVRVLRELWSSNRNLPKKQLSKLVNEKRNEFTSQNSKTVV